MSARTQLLTILAIFVFGFLLTSFLVNYAKSRPDSVLSKILKSKLFGYGILLISLPLIYKSCVKFRDDEISRSMLAKRAARPAHMYRTPEEIEKELRRKKELLGSEDLSKFMPKGSLPLNDSGLQEKRKNEIKTQIGPEAVEHFFKAMDFLRNAWIDKKNIEENESDAIGFLNKAIELKPLYVEAYVVLQNIYASSACAIWDCHKADEMSKKSIKLSVKHNIDVLDNIYTSFSMDDCLKLESLSEEARRKETEWERLVFFTLFDLGEEKYSQFKGYLRHTEEYRSIATNFFPTLAQIKESEKIVDQEVERFKKALELAPYYRKQEVKTKIASAYSVIAAHYYVEHEPGGIIKFCGKSIAYDAGEGWCYKRLGWAYAKTGEKSKAIKYYEKYLLYRSDTRARAELEKLKGEQGKK